MPDADVSHGFVELNRTFCELSKDVGGRDDVELSRFAVGKRLNWADLTQAFRVVIISEAGSGKTKEIHRVAESMRAKGMAAFFLRLEHIANDFEDSFEVGTFNEFSAWLSSNDEGWLLLDSIDEARLRGPLDFELAIRKLGKKLMGSQQRVHIVITGRPCAWRPKTDLDLCVKHLPYHFSNATVTGVTESGSKRSMLTEDKPENNKTSGYRIVTLVDLDALQIKTFAAAQGIENTQRFLDAVERADAWSFTARPQDLEELAQFWKDRSRIGSRSEILEYSIVRRLTERDQERADARPLSLDRAREGARLVAAAVTLVRESTIRIPDGTANSKGLPIAEILSAWDEKDQATLLSRPIFDEAIYGTVRFHHRSVSEFLTAEWLSILLSRETSRRRIDALLFQNQYGIEVVVPTMRPILPWLAIRDQKTLERVREIAPEVLLEGGDPSKLPLDIRRTVLRQVCDQISSGAREWIDNSAVQRFSNEDLVGDIRELIGVYSTDDDVTLFLLRMIWIGELKEALPDATAFALSTTSSKYTRIAAFRAVRALGSSQDMDEVRIPFLAESPELDRDLLSELLEGLKPTAQNVKWLLDCIVKAKSKELYRPDELSDAICAFVQIVSIDLLPSIISRFNDLLDAAPVYVRRFCEISQRFGWLMRAAARATERLIEFRHPAALEKDSLSVLRKVPVSQQFDRDMDHEDSFGFSVLVPTWSELNRALFWYEAEKSRDSLEKKDREHVTEVWHVSLSTSFWSFDYSDFEYALGQIVGQPSLDNKLLALSLAFRLYVMNGRDRKDRNSLKRATADHSVLSAKLAKYLKPPSLGRQASNRLKADRNRRTAAWERKAAKSREEWHTYLVANSELLRNNGLRAGALSNAQAYLHEQLTHGQNGRWTSGEWKVLIPQFGEDVAIAFRDGVVDYWRRYTPRLRSEGAPANTTPFEVIFGLAGIAIEANETAGWPTGLSPTEVDLACRYASHELNGFPAWFPALFAAHTPIVRAFLLTELRYELSVATTEVQNMYVLYDLSWSGEWAWNDLALDIFEILRNKEPTNISDLGYLLNILQGSRIPDADIAKLASRKSKALARLDHVAHWFAAWVGVDPTSAIPAFANRLASLATPVDRSMLACEFVTRLFGGRRGDISKVRSAFRIPVHLKALYVLMHQHIQAKDDTNRAGRGAYSPGLRDYGQDARNSLAEVLRSIPGKEAFVALVEISRTHPDDRLKPWFTKYAKAKAEIDSNFDAWSALQVRQFNDKLERTPSNHRELAELVQLRLLDLKNDLENGDSSVANMLRTVSLETEMRKFIGRELREKAFGRYSIPQEEELADAKRPDLRFHGSGFDGPVPCELKLADNWSGAECFERIENQLCGDYMRDSRSNQGFFVLVWRGKQKAWILPGTRKRVSFDGLIAGLQHHWEKISTSDPGVERVEVVGIDLTKRSG